MEQKDMTLGKQPKKKGGVWNRLCNNILVFYIESVMLLILGQILAGFILGTIVGNFFAGNPEFANSGAWVTATFYGAYIGIWAVMLLFLRLNRKNRPIMRTLWTKPQGNNVKNFLYGLGIGFGANGICILTAWLHEDIALSFSSFGPVSFLVILLAVFIQSSAEEVLCRGILYQKLIRRYRKPAIAIVGNSLLFALLHATNKGVTALSIINIFLIGIFMSFAVYYVDSLWFAMAAHTAWNFTQNILFGLPNSGVVMPYSIFKLDKAADSFAYDVGFGIEGTVLADVVILAGCVIFYLWGKKHGKSPCDIWADEKSGEDGML